jgi:type IV secretion system protein VirB1
MDFLAFAAECGPAADPVTTAAIVKAESRFDPLVIRDNTLAVTFRPRTEFEAAELVARLEASGDRLAIGLMQITSPWFARLSLPAASLLDACLNLRVGTEILASNYRACRASALDDSAALDCALSTYWAGDGRIGGVYVNLVARLSASGHRMTETPGISDGVLGGGGRFHLNDSSFSFR